MNRYLTLKLAEESAEVGQAAAKVLLHPSARALRKLEGEVADLLAIVSIMRRDGHLDTKRIADMRIERVKREDKKARR